MKLKISRGMMFSFLSIIASLLIGAFIVLLNGEDPLRVYYSMIIQPFSSMKNILNVLYNMTPLMMTALSFIIASKASMINLGIEGQLLLGSLMASFIATLIPGLAWYLYIPIIMAGAALAGAIWALIPGFLKLKYGASEIVTCIMFNYIAEFIVNYVISSGLFKNPTIDQRTPYILPNAHVASLSEMGTAAGTKTLRGVQLNAIFIVALVFVVLLFILLERTKWGYKIRSVGINPNASMVNRVNHKKVMLAAMGLSGAIAGVSATGEILGTFSGYIEGFSPGYGFSGISVALLGRNNPIGAIFGAFFFSVMNQGMMYIGTNTNVPKDFVKVLQTIIIIFIVLSPYFDRKWQKLTEKRKAGKEAIAND